MTKRNKNTSEQQKESVLGKQKSFLGYMLFIGFLAFFLFANTIPHDYNMDDELVTKNHPLTSGGISNFKEIMTSPYYSDEMGYSYGYRPIVHLSFAIEHSLFGESAQVSHFMNVVLFAIVSVLLFKLFIRWLGDKNLYLSLVSVLIFVVHPVHTEVVASIKNRDEILALLFVLLAALCIVKFISKRSWFSLFWSAMFIVLGMLSKKSVYPLVIFLPVAHALFFSITRKRFLTLSAILIIPSAIIASDLIPERLIIMLVLPFAGNVLFFEVMERIKSLQWERLTKGSLVSTGLYSAVSWGLLGVTIYTDYYVFFIVSIVPLLWVLSFNYRSGMLQLIGQCLVMVFFSKDFHFIDSALLLSVGYFFFTKNQKTNSFYPAIFAGVTITCFFIFQYFEKEVDFSIFGKVLAVIVYFWLFFQRRIIALIFTVLIVLMSVVIWNKSAIDLGVFTYSLIMLSLVGFIDYWKPKFNLIRFIPLVILVFYLFQVDWSANSIVLKEQETIEQWAQRVPSADSDIHRDSGRTLEYVENTLVAPHTRSERVSTGFFVLGEYARIMLFPKELSFYYGYEKVHTTSWLSIWVWVSLVFHSGLIFGAFYFLRSNPVISVAIGWYLISILLFSNWVELVAGMVGERLVFIASSGFCLLLGGIVFAIKSDFSFKKRGVVEYLVIFALVLLAGRTVIRNADWKDAVTLMRHDIIHLDNSAQAHNLLATNLMKESLDNTRLLPTNRMALQQEAYHHFVRATEIWPYFFNAWYDRGRVATYLAEWKEAAFSFEKVVELDSTFLPAYYAALDAYDRSGNSRQYLNTARLLFSYEKKEGNYELLARGYYLNNEIDSALYVLETGIDLFPGDEGLRSNYNQIRDLKHSDDITER